MHLYKQEKLIPLKNVIAAIALFVAIVLICMFATGKISVNTKQNEIDTLEQALNEAAVLCYSIEGAYPDSVSYIEENYGVLLDHDKYTVYYSVLGSNTKPVIKVYVN